MVEAEILVAVCGYRRFETTTSRVGFMVTAVFVLKTHAHRNHTAVAAPRLLVGWAVLQLHETKKMGGTQVTLDFEQFAITATFQSFAFNKDSAGNCVVFRYSSGDVVLLFKGHDCRTAANN